MKCAYKTVLNQQRAERDDRLLTIQEHRARANLFAIALIVAKTQFKFDTEQLKKMMDGMFEEAAEAFSDYKDETQADFDPATVPFLLKGFANQIEALEVDIKAIEAKHAFVPISEEKQQFWSKERKNKLIGRLQILEDREASYKAYLYGFMLYLYHEYGYEGEKLSGYYDEVRFIYHYIWSKYLECNQQTDSLVADMVDRQIYTVQREGINVTGMTSLEKTKTEEKSDNEKGEDENG